jgi:hypothetical protein
MANSSMPWVKLYIDMLDDTKLGKLSRSHRLLFVELLLLAGECDADGGLINGDTPMTTEDIAWRLRADQSEVFAGKAELMKAGLLVIDADVTCITNFSKRQGRSQADKRAAWRERKQRQKENDLKAESDSRVNHAGVTQDSPPRVEESREEGEERRGEDICAGAPIITPISPDADIANATAKTDYDALARSAGIANQPAPQRKPRKLATNLTVDTTDDERVRAYLRILRQDEITRSNAEHIASRVSDLGLWVATLERWAYGDGSVSYKPTNFSGMFENYDRRVTQAGATKPANTNGRQPLAEPKGFAVLRQMMGGGNGE